MKVARLDDLERRVVRAYTQSQLSDLTSAVPGDLDKTCGLVEAVMPSLVVGTCLDSLARQQKAIFIGGGRAFALGETQYELRAGPSVHDPDTFDLAITADCETPSPTKRAFAVGGLAPFKRIEVSAVPSVESFIELFAGCAAQAIEATYDFLLEWLERRANGLPSRGPEGLYAELRSVVPDHASDVWLYALVGDRGFYIPDREARTQALRRLTDARGEGSTSPLQYLGTFSEKVLPLELLFSRHAIKTEKGLQDDFADAKYSPGMGGGEARIYGSPALISQPLVKEGTVRLVAGYPVDLREHVQDELYNNRDRFGRVIESTRADLHKQLSALLHLQEDPEEKVRLLDAFDAKPGFLGFTVNLNLVAQAFLDWLKRRRAVAQWNTKDDSSS